MANPFGILSGTILQGLGLHFEDDLTIQNQVQFVIIGHSLELRFKYMFQIYHFQFSEASSVHIKKSFVVQDLNLFGFIIILYTGLDLESYFLMNYFGFPNKFFSINAKVV